ncbi:auxin-responsive protein IAA9-like [Salvia divinorum]|uniref:Auxin-responsive protein n=1 Tax=Salvia divinorum TaxID=28513 RepID=A0ABD1G865_SALDI
MSAPLLGVGGDEYQNNITLLSSPTSLESVCQNGSELKERNYMGLSDCSSVDSSAKSSTSDYSCCGLNLKATELRLGPPGSLSLGRGLECCPESSTAIDEKLLFPLHPLKALVTGNKRVFSDAMNGTSEGKHVSASEVDTMLSPRPSLKPSVKASKEVSAAHQTKVKEAVYKAAVLEMPHAPTESRPGHIAATNNDASAPATKAQVVGWPPVRQFRKNNLTTTSKNNDEGLSSALEKMFSCFTIGQYGSHGAPGAEMMNESKLKDLLNGSEYVLTYEDKDGDWMLVGDVPWEMFIDTCKRLRIMKSSDAIGLAPRAVQKNQGKK